MKKVVKAIPDSWAEVNLIQCFEENIGGANILSSEYADSGIPIILKSDVQPMCQTVEPTKFVPANTVKLKYESRRIVNGDLLLCMRDLSQKAQILGLITACEERQTGYLVAQGVTILRSCKIDGKFISYFTNTEAYRAYIFKVKRGSTQVHLGNNDVFEVALPLPPLSEQKRIVAKIESTQEKVKTIESSISKAEELIENYRESLLQKAFRGELVPQDPSDEPASKLIERIRTEKAKRSDGKKKKKDELPPIKPKEIPFDIPKSWEWVRLGDLFKFIDYRGRTPQKTSFGLPLITAKNIKKGFISDEPREFIAERDYEKWMTRGIPKVGDIVFTTEAPLGNCAKVSIQTKFALAQRAINFVTTEDTISDYFVFLILSPWFQDLLDKNGTGATVKGIKASKLKLLPVALPPKQEQIRISKYLTEAFEATNIAKAAMNEMLQSITLFSSSLLSSAFCGKLVPQIPSEGTGHDLLEKIKSEQPPESEPKTEKNSAPAGKNRVKK